ncbi:efflux RND transporter periplasmic adaptor subunit [Microbaculum marinum]|uniref:Efflux RND transporter periplasmic adaptor subunit n=1 Tax=Microbaculum marinum TaxID=1764581 RepID=A0AAW9RU17_9HYPH
MRSSYIWALLIMVAIGGWLASGQVIIGGQGDKPGPSDAVEAADGALPVDADASDDSKPFRVRVRTLSAIDRTAELKIRGRTEADQRVELRAQTAGLVERIDAQKGASVKAGEVICKLEAGSRDAHLLRAQAGVEQAQLDYDGASQLSEKGYAAESRVRATKAALDAARATLSEMKLDMERTSLQAPFDGVIDDIPAKIGTLLNVGDLCAEIVAADPLLVVARVSERDVGKLEVGMPGTARLVTGDTAEGTVRYIAPSADEATRTFRIELEVDNADHKLRDGVTSEIAIPLETTKAHRFSPAILTLDDKGVMGVRTVDDDNRVGFEPVKILGNEDGTIWVSGLPERVTVITVGQEYVIPGELVEPVFETARNDTQAGAAASEGVAGDVAR